LLGRRWVVNLLAVVLFCCLASSAWAQRPVAPKLLPEATIAYIRVADTPLMVERFRETALGRIGQDEEVKPLVSQLYTTLQEAWGQIEDRVGVPLDQLLRIPQGEICLAYVSSKDGPSGVVFLLDVKDQLPAAQKLLDKGEAFLTDNGGTKTVEMEGELKLNVYASAQGQSVVQFEQDGTHVFATSKDLIKSLRTAWTGGGEAKTLAENDKFISIMNRCAGSVDDPPQITWYVDAIEVVRRVSRGNSALQTGLALLPVLGLDGLKGVGGSVTFATGEFDDVFHTHLLLESPRGGVLEMVAFGSGDVTPEPWIPADAASYFTLHWKLQDTFNSGAKLYNSLMSEGALQQEVKVRISANLGVDFETEVLPALDGRLTLASWIEKPVRLNSQVTAIGIKLKDADAFRPTFDKVIEKFQDRLEKQSFGGTAYYLIQPQQPNRPAPAPNEAPPTMRQPQACVALLGDYILFTDSREALQKVILTGSEPGKSLANELDFKLIASKIKRQNGGEFPAMLQFARPEEGLRFLYDLATADDTKRRLSQQADNNNFFKGVDKAMKDNPLPSFAVIAKYLAPGGGMITSDETGIHYSTFTLRRK